MKGLCNFLHIGRTVNSKRKTESQHELSEQMNSFHMLTITKNAVIKKNYKKK